MNWYWLLPVICIPDLYQTTPPSAYCNFVEAHDANYLKTISLYYAHPGCKDLVQGSWHQACKRNSYLYQSMMIFRDRLVVVSYCTCSLPLSILVCCRQFWMFSVVCPSITPDVPADLVKRSSTTITISSTERILDGLVHSFGSKLELPIWGISVLPPFVTYMLSSLLRMQNDLLYLSILYEDATYFFALFAK